MSSDFSKSSEAKPASEDVSSATLVTEASAVVGEVHDEGGVARISAVAHGNDNDDEDEGMSLEDTLRVISRLMEFDREEEMAYFRDTVLVGLGVRSIADFCFVQEDDLREYDQLFGKPVIRRRLVSIIAFLRSGGRLSESSTITEIIAFLENKAAEKDSLIDDESQRRSAPQSSISISGVQIFSFALCVSDNDNWNMDKARAGRGSDKKKGWFW